MSKDVEMTIRDDSHASLPNALAAAERAIPMHRSVTFDDSKPAPNKLISGTGLGRIRSNITRQNSKEEPRSGSSTPALSMQHSNIPTTHLEDLEAFPTTSLHSFSFAAQHDTIAARHNIVSRSIEYLRERLTEGQRSVSSHERIDTKMADDDDDNDDDDEHRAAPSNKPANFDLRINLNGVNERTFDTTHRPLQTAPIPTRGKNNFEIAMSDHSSRSSSRRSSNDFGGSRSTTTTAGTSNQSHVNQIGTLRGRASSFSDKYPDLRAQLQSSLSCTNLPTLNSHYQSSPLQPVHSTNRWGQQLTQAVFTTTSSEPWQILSANDYAMMIFGMGRDAIRRKSLIDYIVEDRREWIKDKLKDMQGDGVSEGKVLLCGDVLPVQKRLGTGAASIWVKGRQNGMIWVIEEIEEGECTLSLDSTDTTITSAHGDAEKVFDRDVVGQPLRSALMTLPRLSSGALDLDRMAQIASYTLVSSTGSVPCTVEPSVFSTPEKHKLRVSFLPHVAGILVVSAETLQVISANSVSTNSLFGYKHTSGFSISKLIPQLPALLNCLREENGGDFNEGHIVPELAFRDAMKKLSSNSNSSVLRGIESLHRDKSVVHVDIQMRVSSSPAVTSSDTFSRIPVPDQKEKLYAFWISYERGLTKKAQSEVVQTAVSQAKKIVAPHAVKSGPPSPLEQTERANEIPVSDVTQVDVVPRKIKEYQILEEMGAGAYGQVKLARYGRKRQRVVLKYVTKARILVDTWTRDRKLGTVPLEIHVLNHLKQFPHRNLVEMKDFFEDDLNYYIVMSAHIPGMDLFDYIELNTSMTEWECKCISLQVAKALEHLHSLDIVHRDIKDENVVLDRNGWVKLIDFGSANYCRNGPFDTFHGTLDYASPEALDGRPYNGKEQDVWACGILFYTLIYKENPFYNIDEIMDRDLRIPYIVSDDSIDLIRKMLNRDLSNRITMQQVISHPWYQDCQGDVQEKVKIDIPQR